MDFSPNLLLPYLAAAQAQKHVTLNEALRLLDALVQLVFQSRALAAPPASPANGARYIVAAAPTGAWSGNAGAIAAWQDGAWAFLTPRAGWLAWIVDEAAAVVFNGIAWSTLAGQTTPLLGINASADTTNRLALASAASLFNNAGNGHQLKINKAAPADTGSVLLQTAFSGRAELGLAGDDNFHLKVSADGAAWKEALVIDRATGAVALPQTPGPAAANLLVNGDFQVNQRGFAGGALAAGSYGVDRWKADTGGANLSLSGFSVALASGAIVQVVEPAQFGAATLAAAQLTISVQSLTGGNLAVTAGSATGTIAAGSGVRSVTLTTAAGDTGNLAVTLGVASGAPVFAQAKLETGASATAWSSRPSALEWQLCQRYFQKSFAATATPANGAAATGVIGYATSATALQSQSIPLLARMRAAPSVGVYAPSVGAPAAGQWVGFNAASGYLAGAATAASASSDIAFTTTFNVASVVAGSILTLLGHWTASAEL